MTRHPRFRSLLNGLIALGLAAAPTPVLAGAGIDGRLSASQPGANPAIEANAPKVRGKRMIEAARPSLELLAPNLSVELFPPSAPGGSARVVVRNLGKASAGSFFVQNEATLSCEAGKLTSPATVNAPNVLVNGLAPGAAVEHQFAPSGGFPATGCYWRIASIVDPGNVVLESSEDDNTAKRTVCVGSSCY